MGKLGRSFYQGSAIEIAPQLLGKFLVFKTKAGTISGQITEVEAYPAFLDNVSHGNKRTGRTEVMYKGGGYVYIYLIYGIHYQFAVVVNKPEIPEVVFIRSVIPTQGIEIMKNNFCRNVADIKTLSASPGNLCKSFGIDKDLYGADLTDETIFIEDRNVHIPDKKIVKGTRIGISDKLKGHDQKLRFFLKL